MINTDRLQRTFLTLIRIDGQSGNEIKVAEYIKKCLNELNIEWIEDEAGSSYGGNSGNIIAAMSSDVKLPAIFICAHMDTIQPTLNVNPVINQNIIASDGTTILGADDRAGVAIILEIIKSIKEYNIKTLPLKFIFTVAEEIGMYGSKYLKTEDINSKLGFVFDSSAEPGKIIIAAPSAVKISIRVNGKAAHAAVHPEQGINAISIACNAIAKIKVGRISETCTMNFGTIKGGTLINIVPDEVEIEGEIRSLIEDELNEQVQFVNKIFENSANQFGGKIELINTRKYYSFNLDENDDVVNIVKDAIKETGCISSAIKYPGGSDANVFNALGIPTVNLGIGYKNVHSTSEFIPIINLIKAAQIGLEIITSSIKYFSEKTKK